MASPSAEERWDRLRARVEERRVKDRVPGAALGVVLGDGTFTAGLGVTNVNHPLDVTDETYFQVGSVSKTFAATAVLRLCERGEAYLDSTVRTHLPGWGVACEETSTATTIRHLLTHMGGWEGDWFRRTGQGDDAVAKYMDLMKDIPQLAPLGAVWSYNNAGFAVLGRIVEEITGTTYEKALRDLVLDPLGLDECRLDHADVMVHRFATGHHLRDDEVAVAEPWPLPRYAWAAGGVMCHVKELLRYARFHLGDGKSEAGEEILSTATIEHMRSPQAAIWEATREAMGLSWFLKDDPEGFRQMWHGGGTTGQVCMLHLVPERSFAVAVLTNASHGRHLLRHTVREALAAFLDFESPNPEPLGAPEEKLAPLAGFYTRPFSDMELGLLGGRLLCQYLPKGGFPTEDTPAEPTPPAWALDFCAEDRLLILDGDVKDGLVDVIRREDGSVGWLRFGGRIYCRKEGP